MAAQWHPYRYPEFHADPVKFPKEQWKDYKLSLSLAHQALDKTPSDNAKKAQLLAGLRGPAKEVLKANPELLEKGYDDVLKFLDEKFDRPSPKKLIDISDVVQEPGEAVFSYVARLKEAAQTMTVPGQGTMRGLRIDIVEDANQGGGDESTPTVKIERVTTSEGSPEAKKLVEDVQKDILDRFLLPHFLNGLREEIRMAVIRDQPKNFETAIKSAEEFERYQEIYGGESRRSKYAHTNVAMPQVGAGPVAEAASHLQALNANPPNKFRQQPPQRRINTDIVCWGCGRKGHVQRECRRPEERRPYMQHGPRMEHPAATNRQKSPGPRHPRGGNTGSGLARPGNKNPHEKRVHFNSQQPKNGKRPRGSPWRRKQQLPQIMACMWDDDLLPPLETDV